MNKEIIFPPDQGLSFQGHEAVFNNIDWNSYKVLAYIDSQGCSECKLELHYWIQFMDEIKEKSQINVNLLFVINTVHERYERIGRIIEYMDFKHPVWFDYNASLEKVNHFPEESTFHFFLLNETNRVVAIGNPISNSSIWDSYIEILTQPQKN